MMLDTGGGGGGLARALFEVARSVAKDPVATGGKVKVKIEPSSLQPEPYTLIPKPYPPKDARPYWLQVCKRPCVYFAKGDCASPSELEGLRLVYNNG